MGEINIVKLELNYSRWENKKELTFWTLNKLDLIDHVSFLNNKPTEDNEKNESH